MTRTLLTVSGTVPTDLDHQIANGSRPRPDYVALADAMSADLLDVAAAQEAVWGARAPARRASGAPARCSPGPASARGGTTTRSSPMASRSACHSRCSCS